MNDEMSEDLVWLEPQTPEEVINELINTHKKTDFYVLYSGGKDSSSVAHFIAENYPDNFKGVVFTNTGISSPITRKFALDYTKKMGWNLTMTWAHKTYYDIVMRGGFPAPAYHRIVMGYLKSQSWRRFMDSKLQAGEKACFISGVRKKESMVRDKIKFYTKKPIDVDGRMVFAKPFLYKNGEQLYQYFIENGLKKSPAYEWANKSGECWCGCFSGGVFEIKMIEKYDPFLFKTIKWLEKELQLHGTPTAKKRPLWGLSVGTVNSEDQLDLESFFGEKINANEDYCGESCAVE